VVEGQPKSDCEDHDLQVGVEKPQNAGACTSGAALKARDPDEFSSARALVPRSGLSDREENGTANHAEHAKGGGALQGQHHASDLKAKLAEVEQQTEMEARMRSNCRTMSPNVRAQRMIRLDRRSTLSSPDSICVFCVFCGSIFLFTAGTRFPTP
jgi:hypothetical protein